jgi:hypothetical protein
VKCECVYNFVCVQGQTVLYLSQSVCTETDKNRIVTETSHDSEQFIHLG